MAYPLSPACLMGHTEWAQEARLALLTIVRADAKDTARTSFCIGGGYHHHEIEGVEMSEQIAALESEIEDILCNCDLSPSEKRDAIRRLLVRYGLLDEWDEFLRAFIHARRRAPATAVDIISALLNAPEFAPLRAMGVGFVSLTLTAWYMPRAVPSIELSGPPTSRFGLR